MRWRSLISTVSRWLGVPVAVILISPPVWGTDLPPHGPLRILITSDGVNSHGLPPELLVGPGDICEALSNPKNGLNIDKAPNSIVEIPTNQIELATEALSVSRCDPPSYDVLIYFSHRQPNNGTPEENAARQAAFVAAVESFLEAGGGVIAFHHCVPRQRQSRHSRGVWRRALVIPNVSRSALCSVCRAQACISPRQRNQPHSARSELNVVNSQ